MQDTAWPVASDQPTPELRAGRVRNPRTYISNPSIRPGSDHQLGGLDQDVAGINQVANGQTVVLHAHSSSQQQSTGLTAEQSVPRKKKQKQKTTTKNKKQQQKTKNNNLGIVRLSTMQFRLLCGTAGSISASSSSLPQKFTCRCQQH